jgi:hypothetical protein
LFLSHLPLSPPHQLFLASLHASVTPRGRLLKANQEAAHHWVITPGEPTQSLAAEVGHTSLRIGEPYTRLVRHGFRQASHQIFSRFARRRRGMLGGPFVDCDRGAIGAFLSQRFVRGRWERDWSTAAYRCRDTMDSVANLSRTISQCSLCRW